MNSAEIEIGKRYAMRLKVSTAEPLVQVQVIDKVGRKGAIKIRHADQPHQGLEEYVKSRNIIVPWSERRALLRDGERYAQIEKLAMGQHDRGVAIAIETVLYSTGEPGAGFAITSV